MKTLRPYQNEFNEAVKQDLDAGINKLLGVLPTGMGKSLCCVNIAKNFERTGWGVHSEELAEQAAMNILKEILEPEELNNLDEINGLLRFFRENKHTGLFESDLIRKVKNLIGFIKADLFEKDTPFVVASMQTLHRRLHLIPPDQFNLFICDETHLFVSNTFVKSVNYLTPKLLLGVTATPDRLDGVSLTDLFDKITYQRDMKYGVDNGYLCELDGIRVSTDISLDKIRTTGGDLNKKDLTNVVDDPLRNKLIVEKWQEYALGRKTLAFAVDVKHAMNLCQEFVEQGIRATFVVADEMLCPNRRERVEAFRNGIYDVLVNVEIMTTGVDIPDISCILWARPTESKTLYIQGTGRGTRLKSEFCLFKNCLIIDIVDNTSKHELINTWTLEEDKKTEDKVFISKEKKLQLLLAEKAERESRMKEIERDQHVVLLPLPKVLVTDSMKNRDDASAAQLKWLADIGHDTVNTHWTKGQATEVLSNLRASDQKIAELKNLGYDVKHGATIGQHSLVMERGTREIGFEKAARARGMNGLPIYNVL